LARLLNGLGVRTEVIAPSLIPIVAGAKVKTDKRDGRRLAHLYRAGELTAVHIPTPKEEAIRDLARTRADLVIDRTRSRHRLSKFLVRHGEVYRAGVQRTMGHETWLRRLAFEDAALTQTYSRYRAIVAGLDAHLAAVESDLKIYLETGHSPRRSGASPPTGASPSWRAHALSRGLRLVARPGGHLADGFCGLVPSEYSSGNRVSLGRITKAATPTCGANWSSRPGLSAPPGGGTREQEALRALLS
jgi:transposase